MVGRMSVLVERGAGRGEKELRKNIKLDILVLPPPAPSAE
jgi:hypothetical protein